MNILKKYINLIIEQNNNKPSSSDMEDAIEHAKEVYDELPSNATINDFELIYLGKLDYNQFKQYDDIDPWTEEIEDDQDLEKFRGKKWKDLSDGWNNNPPPVIIVTGETFSTIGDGRGRITLAKYKNISIDSYELRYKK